jgi:hypothetical protein
VAIAGAALAAAGCGSASNPGSSAGGTTTAAGRSFKVSVPTASFAAKQSLAAKERFVIAVRNTGDRALPNVAVTV